MITIGHRGAAGYAPENTLKSIARALDLGAHWVEIDVYSVDNQLVVIHDDKLERTTNGHGYLSDKSFSYLRSLDAGQGEKIPILDEVFELVNHRAGINIELKGSNTAKHLAKHISDRIARGWSFEEILVSSFDHTELATLKDIEPRIRRGGLIYGIPQDYAAFGEKLKLHSVNPSIHFINQQLIDDAHKRGFLVLAYTANDPRDIEKMASMGVDGLFSDYPDRVLNLPSSQG